MRVLVTGAAGQLGTDTVSACRAAGDEVIAADRDFFDVCDRDGVLAAIHGLTPQLVINCAAWTAVDACEADPPLAMLANGMAVRWVAEACAATGAHLVQVSTDYVFDGALDRPYHEWDAPNPRSVYGASKLAGEREALALGAGSTVVRTSWVCGAHGNNMVKTVMRLARDGSPLRFVTDQVGCPTFTQDLAVVLRQVGRDHVSGVVHATNQGPVSWYEFAREVVAAMGNDPETVQRITTAELVPPRPAERPANSVLDNAVLRGAGYPPLRDFREPLRETVAALLA